MLALLALLATSSSALLTTQSAPRWLGASALSSRTRPTRLHLSSSDAIPLTSPPAIPLTSPPAPLTSPPHVCVVGAGWAGWGAARSLLHSGCKVTLIDGQDDPTGELGTFTPTGKPFDAGTKGFWLDYPNIYGTLEQDLKTNINDVLTPCTNSSFYSPYGLEATAPVFGDSPILPSPLGQVAASVKLFERLPLIDRASAAGLLLAILDLSPATMKIYDKMTALELFERFGLSKRLIDDFLRPTLLVGLFKPPEELSAAVTMELLLFYAFAHQTSFDVRWIKEGSVASSFFSPLYKHLQSTFNTAEQPDMFTVLPKTFVTSINVNADSNKVSEINCITLDSTKTKMTLAPDGVVLALGAKGLRAVMANSPILAKVSPMLTRAATIPSIDCIAVRIWLDKTLQTRSPANVFANFPELRGAGATFFMLDQLQPNENKLWGDETGEKKGEGEESRGSVLACDFYNAASLMSLSDEAITSLLMEQLLPSGIPSFRSVAPKVVDCYVQRYAGAVNHFAPNTFDSRPRINVPGLSNVKMAGDWVWMEDREPKSKGLCQERAYVSGMEAASSLVAALGDKVSGKPLPVIPVREDEIQVEIGRAVIKSITEKIFALPLLGALGGALFARRR